MQCRPMGWGQEVDRSKERGLSLLELMTVAAIMGIAAAIAVPYFAKSSAQAQLKQAVIELTANLNLARMAAMSRNTTVTANVSLVGGRVKVTFGGILPDLEMPRRVVGVGGAASIQFNSLGLLSGVTTTQLITLTNSQGLTYAVQVSPGGKIRWCPNPTCSS